jgi:DNA-binding CsgD family transcriptional regulator
VVDRGQAVSEGWGFTAREQEIAEALLQGYTTEKQLVKQLAMSRSTVSKHLMHMYRKTDSLNRAALVLKIVQAQWQREVG